MSLTPLGLLFIPLAVLLAWRGRGALLVLLPVAAVLQAGSICNVVLGGGRYGITAFSLVGALLGLDLLREVRSRWPLLRSRLYTEPGAGWWIAYAAWAGAGALWLPLLFAGLPVFALQHPLGFDAETRPLALGVSQWAQLLNLGVLALLFVHLWTTPAAQFARLRALLLRGLGLACALVLLVGAWERMSLLGWVASSELFWMSNPGYTQSFSAMVAGVLRVSAPFSEPSYASSFLAAMLLGLLTVAAFGRRARAALLAAIVVAMALLNTLGSSGLVTVALGAVVLLLALAWNARSTAAASDLRRRARWAWRVALTILLVLAALLWLSPWAEALRSLAAQTLIEKFRLDQPGLMGARHRSNLHGFELLLQSGGLGVGMGGNRASSYLLSLLSNLGLPGFLLWLGMNLAVLRAYVRSGLGLRMPDRHGPGLQDGQWFALGAWCGISVAVALAIPDLNFPVYWLFVLLAMAQAPRAGGDARRVLAAAGADDRAGTDPPPGPGAAARRG